MEHDTLEDRLRLKYEKIDLGTLNPMSVTQQWWDESLLARRPFLMDN